MVDNGGLLKMAPIKDGSFGPVAATAVMVAAAATPPPCRGGGLKNSAVFFVLDRFKLLWTVLNRFELFLDRFCAVLERFRPEIWSHL